MSKLSKHGHCAVLSVADLGYVGCKVNSTIVSSTVWNLIKEAGSVLCSKSLMLC